ncbi:hypothetical protein AKG12_24625 [Agrobacterium sp. SUL3]|nr:hypothetical protein AKG12_24625 [Agrobacterium sp. SUL3]
MRGTLPIPESMPHRLFTERVFAIEYRAQHIGPKIGTIFDRNDVRTLSVGASFARPNGRRAL